MADFTALPVSSLLAPRRFACDCGREHACALRYLKIGRDTLNELPDMLDALGFKRPLMVCDENTWEAAGQRAADILSAAGRPFSLCRFDTRERLMPSEWALGALAMRFDPACDGILGVGGGVINDLCKMMGRAAGVPTAIVATAPSMDGFASNSGAMEVGGVKRTIYTPAPVGVLCDTLILAAAPRRMLLAGVGDMIAKYTSICDWRIARLVTGEYYCERVAELMRSALRRVTAQLDGVAAREPEAVGAVAEGLVLAGIAMSFAGVSRPASGLEHCFSHIWEMMALERGRPYDLHGIQVGVGTMLALPVYARARAFRPDMAHVEAAIARFDESAWEANLRRVFGRAADALISQARRERRNDPVLRRHRARVIVERWEDILAIMDEELPDVRALRAGMEALGLPLMPADIGISDQDALDALICSRDIRDRYLFTSMLWDIGRLEDGAEALKEALRP